MSARSGHIWLEPDFLSNPAIGSGLGKAAKPGQLLTVGALGNLRPRFRRSGRTVRCHADLFRAADGNVAGHQGRLIGSGAPTTPKLPECDPGPRVHRSALRKTIDSRPAGQAGGPVAVPFHPRVSSACGPDTASIPARPANRARQGTADHHTDAGHRDL